ncbi:hypothetical protein L208DRAFT_28578 [Tricholoma matsutake]|nr:hypothetical protein L208DRAFT_28578 [Tricholoma matsutake 945]
MNSAMLLLNTNFTLGIAITLFITSVGMIIRKKRETGECNLPLVIPSVLIFILATVNIIGLWYSMYLAFVVNGHDPQVYLGLIRTPAKTVFQIGQIGTILLTDALMVYRTWIIWNHNPYIITIPCLTFGATVISGVYFVNRQHHISIQTSIFTMTITQWTITFLMCSFFTTVYSTGVIVFKLWKSQIELQKYGVATNSSLTHRITRILVESAALYSMNHLLYVILYEVKNQVEITTGYLEANVATITCSLIIIRSETAFNHLSGSMSMNSVPTINYHVPTMP